MTIAVHIDVPQQHVLANGYLYPLFLELATRNPSDHFIFIVPPGFGPIGSSHKNITPVITSPEVRSPLLLHYFYNFKLPRILSKYNVDVFFSNRACSLRTKTTQYLFVDSLPFLQMKSAINRQEARYLKRFMPSFVKRASGLIITNASLEPILSKLYPGASTKINLLEAYGDHLPSKPVEEELGTTRARLSEGKQYFVFCSTENSKTNLIRMLKAFSIFKKWQKSNMKLFILNINNSPEPIPELATYKYREDVKVMAVQVPGELKPIMAAAYACVYLPATDIWEWPGTFALSLSVPLIVSSSAFQESCYKDAALYSEHTEQGIASKMMLLYKDEDERKRLVSNGARLLDQHSISAVTEKLWQIIQAR